jgi:hypothetical protein
MYAAIRRCLPAAAFAVTCSALAVAWSPCQAADDSSPVSSQAKQALDTATQLEGFLQQLEKKQETRRPKEHRHSVRTFQELSDLWDRVWKDLNNLCSKDEMELDLWHLHGQSRLPRDDD